VEVKVTFVTADASDVTCFVSGDEQTGQALSHSVRENIVSNRPSPAAVKTFSMVNGLTLLGVLLQGVWAGLFIDRAEREPWVTVHEIGGFVVVVLSLVTALVAITLLRRADPALTFGAVGLLLLLVIQTGLGEGISKAGSQELLVSHVPLAMLIFGLGVYLSVAGARLRRAIS
jgi:heme A synthase